jgi:hypothetical protein
MLFFTTHTFPIWQVQLIQGIEEELEEAIEEVDAVGLADPAARWSAHAAKAVKELAKSSAKCLCHEKQFKRAALPDVLTRLRALLGPAEAARASDEAAARGGEAGESGGATGGEAAYEPTPLSKQVRGMRRAAREDEAASVKRNVSEAFGLFMGRLGRHYEGRGLAAAAPKDFLERIDHWHASCGLPEEVRGPMQTLRIWRNASEHRDEARWQTDGPRSPEEAARHLAALQAAIDRECT